MEARSTASDSNYLKSNSPFLDSGGNGRYLHCRSMEPPERKEGVSGGEITFISISAQGSMKHLCCSPVQGKAPTHPTTTRLKKRISGQVALTKAAQAPVPTHGMSRLEHRALGHVPEAAKWKGLTCYLQSILAYSVKPTSLGSFGKAEPLLCVCQGGSVQCFLQGSLAKAGSNFQLGMRRSRGSLRHYWLQ